MRVIFPLPPLLVAGAALGGLFAPFAVGSVPTDSIGITVANERQFGADVAICHGSASAGVRSRPRTGGISSMPKRPGEMRNML